MCSVQSVPVHIAVLAVARDGAPIKAVSEQATAAGHKVVARATVMDAQNAIRTQLALWIDDPNIDVIIVSGGTESSSASSALKPLISEVLPGFTDLFRYLAFQEIGAGAMHSNAEAARCNLTFVFVLPAAEGAVRAAMDKLILPQLDAKTTPKNLVTQMPRIQNMIEVSAVPTEIVKEKTAGGPGMNSRMPAAATPPRGRPLTANTIARRQEKTADDPPTRPIDVAKLEQQIAISEAGSSPTKRVDLSRLPKLPPGADDTLDDGEAAPPERPNGRHARLGSEPIAPPAPASRQIQHTPTRGSGVVKPPPELGESSPASPREIENAASRNAGVAIATSPSAAVVGPPREIQHTPSRGLGVVAKAPATSARHTPSVPPRRTTTEAVAVVPPSRPSEPRIKKPTDPPPLPPMAARAKQSSGQVPAVPPQRPKQPSGIPAVPPGRAKQVSGQVPAVPAQRPKQPSGQVPAVPARSKQPSGPTPTVPSPRAKQASGPDPSAPERQVVTIPEDWEYPDSGVHAAPDDPPPHASDPAAARAKQPSGPGVPPPTPRAKSPSRPAPEAPPNGRGKRPTDSASLGTATQSIPVVSPPPDMPLTMRATSQGIEVVSPTAALDPAAAVRLPPRRRDDGDMAFLVSTPLSRGTDDLPLGEFSYPIKKTSKVGWILALLSMAALGFGAVVFIVPMLTSQGAASTSSPATTPEPPAVVTAIPIDAQGTPEITPDPVPVEPDPTSVPTTNTTTTKKTGPTTTKTTGTTGTQTRPGTKQTVAKTGTGPVTTPTGTGAGSQAGDEPEQEPPTAPPITDSDCDEVACVLHKYNRPCCEKYRPAQSDIAPRAAGGLPTELDKAAVRSGIEKVKPAVVACGEKNGDKGTVRIAMKVKPDGSVADASVASAPSDALGSCVASALGKAQFAKTVNGGTFTYPFAF